MTPLFQVSVVDPAHQEMVRTGGSSLRDLCQKEAAAFSDWLRANEPNFRDGLANWERQILAVYLYKKSRGLDEPEKAEASVFLEEGQDGTA